jgi:hypothetical protein
MMAGTKKERVSLLRISPKIKEKKPTLLRRRLTPSFKYRAGNALLARGSANGALLQTRPPFDRLETLRRNFILSQNRHPKSDMSTTMFSLWHHFGEGPMQFIDLIRLAYLKSLPIDRIRCFRRFSGSVQPVRSIFQHQGPGAFEGEVAVVSSERCS